LHFREEREAQNYDCETIYDYERPILLYLLLEKFRIQQLMAET
jgi:hypothetical protein